MNYFTIISLISFLFLHANSNPVDKCGTTEKLHDDIENHALQFIKDQYNLLKQDDVTYDLLSIPIAWHILYNTEESNIYESQLQSQIDVLNKDFTLANEDANNTPSVWKSIRGNFSINFYTKIIKKVPIIGELSCDNGYTENEFDCVKYDKNGGSNAIDTELNLNIWIIPDVTIDTEGILGISKFPASFKENPQLDGIVVDSMVVGTIGNLRNGNSLGRTLTHEIGHWMNLRHIWGDGGCDKDDSVNDTPIASTNHYCGIYEDCEYPLTSTCGTSDMFMNFMDYGNDDKIVMFTHGQMLRARAVFAKGGVRNSITTQTKTPADSNDANDNKSNDINIILIIINIIIFVFSMVGIIFCICRLYSCVRRPTPRGLSNAHVELTEIDGAI
jgi:hypothetical protein